MRPPNKEGPGRSPDPQVSGPPATTPGKTTIGAATLTPAPDAWEAECPACGWWTLQASHDAAIIRFSEGHACRGGAS